MDSPNQPDSAPDSVAPAPETILQEIHDDLHAVLAKLEHLEHEITAEVKAGIEVLVTKVKALL